MASPCEVLAAGAGPQAVREAVGWAIGETVRIEKKFSRYRDDNIIHRINAARGRSVDLDEETQRLLSFAEHLYKASDGAFDITAGVLSRVWKFDGSDRIPDPSDVEGLLPLVGWHQVDWSGAQLRMPSGMQIDLGGIGKEYATDRVAEHLDQHHGGQYLVNFGGDMRACRPPSADSSWEVGIESPHEDGQALRRITLTSGGVATSGDARRFLLRDGVRYGHILDPRTGWPIQGAPRSVTVAAGTCTEAGVLSTLAMLRGEGARSFLEEQQCPFWCLD